MTDKIKKALLFYLQMFVGLIIYVCVINLLGIGCPIRRVIHMPCPACGITRSWMAVLSFDFHKAWEYHPLFWFMPIYVLIIIHYSAGYMKTIPKWLFYLFVAVGGLVIVSVYVYRIINGFGPV